MWLIETILSSRGGHAFVQDEGTRTAWAACGQHFVDRSDPSHAETGETIQQLIPLRDSVLLINIYFTFLSTESYQNTFESLNKAITWD